MQCSNSNSDLFGDTLQTYLVSLSTCVSIDIAKHDVNVEPGDRVDQSNIPVDSNLSYSYGLVHFCDLTKWHASETELDLVISELELDAWNSLCSWIQ